MFRIPALSAILLSGCLISNEADVVKPRMIYSTKLQNNIVHKNMRKLKGELASQMESRANHNRKPNNRVSIYIQKMDSHTIVIEDSSDQYESWVLYMSKNPDVRKMLTLNEINIVIIKSKHDPNNNFYILDLIKQQIFKFEKKGNKT